MCVCVSACVCVCVCVCVWGNVQYKYMYIHMCNYGGVGSSVLHMLCFEDTFYFYVFLFFVFSLVFVLNKIYHDYFMQVYRVHNYYHD